MGKKEMKRSAKPGLSEAGEQALAEEMEAEKPLMPSRRTAWIEAARVFVLSRLVILALTTLVTARLPLSGQATPRNCSLETSSCFLSWWMHYDGIVYVQLADQGYRLLRDTVFFPLWPLLIHGMGVLFGSSEMSYHLSSLLLANLFCYLALVVFYSILSKDFDSTSARNALFYLTFSPYALFFFAGYAESLFLFLCLAVFFFLQRDRWWLAGICGFLAALTRSPGFLLVVPFLVVLLQRFWTSPQGRQITWQHKVRASFPLLLIPLGIVVFMLYLGMTEGDPLAFSTQEAQAWDRHFTFPLISLLTSFQNVFQPPQQWHLLNFLNLLFAVVSLAILARGWKRLPLHYSLFALVIVLFSLSYPLGTLDPLTAVPRYLMVVFPIFVLLALWGKRPSIDRIILACSLPLFALNVVLFVSHYYIG